MRVSQTTELLERIADAAEKTQKDMRWVAGAVRFLIVMVGFALVCVVLASLSNYW